MFQLPLGPWPYPEGTRLRFKARPQWGVGTVKSDKGYFTVVWPSGDGVTLRWRFNQQEWDWLGPERVQP